MWVPKPLVDILGFAKEDLAAMRAENRLLTSQLIIAQTHLDWFRLKVNDLEYQNKALLEKAYGIKVPAPEIVRSAPTLDPSYDPRNFSFEDIGEDVARLVGQPSYDPNTNNA